MRALPRPSTVAARAAFAAPFRAASASATAAVAGAAPAIRAYVGPSAADHALHVAICAEGLLVARCSGGARLEVRTENQLCDGVGFDRGEGALQVRLERASAQEVRVVAAGGGRASGLIPEKYSVDIETCGGAVELARLEGSCRIASGGGEITVDKVASADIELRSGGGDVIARALQGHVVLHTGGGGAQVRRCQAPSLDLDTGGGDVDIAALYGDELRVRSGGGAVALRSVHASVSADVDSGGGDVTIDAADCAGPLRVQSRGGSISVTLSSVGEGVALLSDGGAVHVQASLSLPLRARLCGGAVSVDEQHDTATPCPPGAREIDAVLNADLDPGGRAPAWRRSEPAELVVQAGDGTVELGVGGWLMAAVDRARQGSIS